MDLGEAERIHFEPAGGGSAGHTYSFTDNPPGEGPWAYWLSDIDTHGVETFHLPSMQQAMYVNKVFMPILIGK
jgi:hypothetical protein